MKFKVELESETPAEKALFPFLKVQISSDDITPRAAMDLFGSIESFLKEFDDRANRKRLS